MGQMQMHRDGIKRGCLLHVNTPMNSDDHCRDFSNKTEFHIISCRSKFLEHFIRSDLLSLEKRRVKEKSSCSHLQHERVLQRSHIELHCGAQLKDKRQWLEFETREILITHWKIFIYTGMAKPLE